MARSSRLACKRTEVRSQWIWPSFVCPIGLICGEPTSILSRMQAAAVVPFPVFESATAFCAVERSWSLVYDQAGLIAAIANYHDDEGIALTIESGAPNDHGPRLESALRRAIAFAGTERATNQERLPAVMRRARHANRPRNQHHPPRRTRRGRGFHSAGV
jgi:hypothetical protein